MGWVDVNDRLPKKYGWYFCIVRRKDVVETTPIWEIVFYQPHKEKAWGNRLYEVEYWMPIPRSPKDCEYGELIHPR